MEGWAGNSISPVCSTLVSSPYHPEKLTRHRKMIMRTVNKSKKNYVVVVLSRNYKKKIFIDQLSIGYIASLGLCEA